MAKYSAKDIAAWFLENIDRDAGDSITHLKLQKLVYYAQAWNLALFGEPLFDEDFKAWTHGPVVESVFYDYRKFGWEALPQADYTPNIDEKDVRHLEDILEVYGDFSAKHLENMTHKEEPWIQARGGLSLELRSNSIIAKTGMKEYYSKLLNEANDKDDDAKRQKT